MNIEDAQARFRNLESRLQLKFLRRAGRKAALLIRDQASNNAPKDTGALARGMTIKTRKESDTEIHLQVGPSRKEFYGRFLEHGTKHISADPFLAPALEQKGDEAATVFIAELVKEIENAFKKGTI